MKTVFVASVGFVSGAILAGGAVAVAAAIVLDAAGRSIEGLMGNG